ncbi:histidine kinase [Streptomyces sp. NBC_00335]|uniref:sensor histidine kinase n=1 Tax=unclassified Streptomyces TaxID=2593676 RepID=UPI00225420BC|nr:MULTISPECIES: histidine kinase [unclassified Streptomyces]MCX5404942.1 histidine kinase [Streptomyces sp. NBC_00086]
MTASLDAMASAAARDRPSARPAVQLPIALQANALQALCRQVFAFRLVMIALATPVVLSRTAPGAPTHLAGGAVLLTFLLSYVLFREWERFGPLLLRHRWPLVVDWAFFGGLLFLTATPGSPLLLIAVCTPLLAGIVYGRPGAAVYAIVQAAVVALVAEALTLAVLCVLAGAAGASLRSLLLRFGTAGQALLETRARRAVAEAVQAEREHLARELHDSLAKTLHGLALAADSLSRTTDPATLRRQAALVSGAARRAATESREVLDDLRRDLDAPGVSLASELQARIGPDPDVAELRVTGTLPVVPSPVARHLLAVAGEAVENARRHAGAARITVEAAVDAPDLLLVIEDDGRGLPDDVDLASLSGAGRFGLVGMAERAAAIGARLHIGSRPGGQPGTQVRLALPLSALAVGRGV